MLPGSTVPPKCWHIQLLAVANAQNGDTHGPNGVRHARAASFGHAGWPARKDQRAWLPSQQSFSVGVERPNLAVDAAFTQPPRDQLRDLAAEIQDENAFRVLAEVYHGAFQHTSILEAT